MAGTVQTYNGVIMHDVQTLSFEQVTEYDDSRTDKVFDRFIIRTRSIVHPNEFLPDGIGHPVGVKFSSASVVTTNTATDRMNAVHRTLMQPRGHYRFQVGEKLLSATPHAGQPDSDVNNGPKPIRCNITRVVGASCFEVEFEIEICIVYCDAGQAALLATLASASTGAVENLKVLNNRWRITEEIDANLCRHRTIEGTLRVGHISYYPHAFRRLCVPPLEKGFRRKRMMFADTPDGLSLHYQIVDEERYASPPPPAVDWDATYTEISGVGALMGRAEMKIRLTGTPNCDKQKLVAALIGVVKSRLHNIQISESQQSQGSYYCYLEHAAIVEHLHEPVVQAHYVVRHMTNGGQANSVSSPTSTAEVVFNTPTAQFGNPLTIPGYDPKRWPRAGVWIDQSPYGLFAKYLQSPCWPVHGVPTPIYPDQNGGGPNDDPGEGDDKDQIETLIFHGTESSVDWDLPNADGSEQLSSAHPYTFYQVDLEYDLRDGVMHLPIARWGGTPTPPGNPASVMIPIHRGMGTYGYFVHAERVNAWPVIDQAVLAAVDPNGIPMSRLSRQLVSASPDVLADGATRLFKLQVRYRYAMESAPDNDSFYAGGTTPMQRFTAVENRIDGTEVFKS